MKPSGWLSIVRSGAAMSVQRTIFQPPSLRILVLFGFGLVIVPLLIALFSAIYSVDKLTKVSRFTVYRAVRVTQESRILLEKLTAMERSARQYFVLQDPAFFDVYEAEHDEFILLIHNLMNLVGQDRLWRSMKELAAQEFELYRKLMATRWYAQSQVVVRDRFKDLNALVHDLGEQSALLVRQEVAVLDNSYADVKKRILRQSSVLLPISIFLVIVFVYLIIRPIRQLDKAIRRLGRGDLESKILIYGTQDFEYLGERLNWLRERLKQLEENKRRFFRNVSHELKTPLATINEGIGLLADEVVGEVNAEQKNIVNILQSSSTKLDKRINDLMNFSRLQSKADEFSREHFNLHNLISNVIQDYEINLRAHNIVMTTHLDHVKIFGNPNKFRVAFDNLLSNAVKYSPQGGEVRVSLRQIEDGIQLDIEDDGPGIALEERKKVFDLFYRGRTTREAGIKGSGLGLAIVAECVVAHHGTIDILDPKLGKSGAFFRVSIPLDLRQISR